MVVGHAFRIVCALLLIGFHLGSATYSADQAVRLVITAPPNGAIVSPGDLLVVGISSEPNIQLSDVTVEGDQGLGIAADFSKDIIKFAIDKRAPPGQYSLTAKAKSSSGENLESRPVLIDVESSDFPDSLIAYPSVIRAEMQAESVPLLIMGHFPDNTETLLTRSINIHFRSTNAHVATISAAGAVRAVGVGEAMIVVSYQAGERASSISVAVNVPPPVLQITPDLLSLGTSAVGVQPPSQLFSVENVTSDRNVILKNIYLSGEFTQTNDCMDKEPLGPRQVCYVSVASVAESPGQKNGTLNILSNATERPLSISLSAEFVQDHDFALKVTPSPQTVVLGDEVLFAIAVTPIGGFSGSVELTANGLPAGAAVKILPSVVRGGRGSVSVVITTSDIKEAKAYSVELVGSGGGVRHHAHVDFVLVEGIGRNVVRSN
jgi:hypothetical protein